MGPGRKLANLANSTHATTRDGSSESAARRTTSPSVWCVVSIMRTPARRRGTAGNTERFAKNATAASALPSSNARSPVPTSSFDEADRTSEHSRSRNPNRRKALNSSIRCLSNDWRSLSSRLRCRRADAIPAPCGLARLCAPPRRMLGRALRQPQFAHASDQTPRSVPAPSQPVQLMPHASPMYPGSVLWRSCNAHSSDSGARSPCTRQVPSHVGGSGPASPQN